MICKKIGLIMSILSVCACVACGTNQKPSQTKAEEVAKAYAQAVDYEYENPSVIYDFMTNDFKTQMSEKEFIAAFNKERSYPYLTPLFINFDSVTLSEDLMSGVIKYSQAARLPGMIYETQIVYEDNEYHIVDFEELLDGSYLDKFDTVSYDLSSYFDMEVLENNESEQGE